MNAGKTAAHMNTFLVARLVNVKCWYTFSLYIRQLQYLRITGPQMMNAPSDSIFRLLGRAAYVSFTFSLIHGQNGQYTFNGSAEVSFCVQKELSDAYDDVRRLPLLWMSLCVQVDEIGGDSNKRQTS
jgi:hypothetical protein